MLSSQRCYQIVDNLSLSSKEFGKIITSDDLHQLYLSCDKETGTEFSDSYSEPMLWIGIYIAIASFLCTVAMAVDLLYGFWNRKFWFPCKYFTLNAASIMVITVAMKLQVDLSSPMFGEEDQIAKVGGLGFMCIMMANLMPSLASMDNNTLLANIIGLCILVITVIVNICIQINTKVIQRHTFYVGFAMTACFYMAMIILLLIIMISSCLTIPTSKEILESKYQAKNKISLTNPHLQHTQLSAVEKLRHYVRRYWVMAETGNPQFGMASNPLSTASGVICAIVLGINLFLVFTFLYRDYGFSTLLHDFKNQGSSPYKWSTAVIFLTQSIGVVVGTIAPICRCYSVFDFKLGTLWKKNYFMFFKVEKFWTQKLHEWKQNPVLFLSSCPSLRSRIYTAKKFILSLCIELQKVIVRLCKLICLVVTAVPIFVDSYFTRPITSITTDIDEDLRSYALQIDNEMELAERTLKGIEKSMNAFISKAEKEQNNNLLEFLEKSTGFEGVEIFDIDLVQPVLLVEPVNSWSLPIVTLTCIALSLPNGHKDEVEILIRSVGEGLSFAHLVEESLNTKNEYVNIRKTTMILWNEVENNCKWLDNTLGKNVFKGKTTIEVVEWFSDKAKEIVTAEINKSTSGDLVDNSPNTLISANSMYRITQTILFRYQSNIEPITNKQLFDHINGMIADILCACSTNLPRVIRMKCHESVIEKREASVKAAAKLLGKTTKIIERLQTREVPSMDDEKMAYIDEWRLYLKQSVP